MENQPGGDEDRRGGNQRSSGACVNDSTRVGPLSAATQRTEDLNLLARPDRVGDFAHHLTIDEQPDVLPDAVLLVDHPKTDAWEPLIEIVEQSRHGAAAGLHDGPVVRVRAQGGGNVNRVHAGAPVVTA